MSSLLPPLEQGYLPYFLLYAGVAGITHSIVCYVRPQTSLAVFSGKDAPSRQTLTAHVYAVKNLYTAAIRLTAAYNLANRQLYNLAMFTFAGVLWLYGSELLVWKTARLRESWIPIAMSVGALLWMATQRDWYS